MKWKWLKENWDTPIAIFAIVASIGLLLFVWLSPNVLSTDKVSITTAIATAVVAIATGVYAWYTRRLAKANLKMAEEMREQRYSGSLPLLVPDLTKKSIFNTKLEPNEVDYGVLQTGVGLEVTWHNFGNGVAINTRLSFWSLPLNSNPKKAIFFPPQESLPIEIGGRRKFEPNWAGQSYDIPEAHHARLEAEYNDVYERKIKTIQEFRIDGQNGRKRAFLGELYFTINGIRLGKETGNDS